MVNIRYTNIIFLQILLIQYVAYNQWPLQGKSTNSHSHISCRQQYPTTHKNMEYLLNLQIDLLYLITMNLLGIFLSDFENLTPYETQASCIFPNVCSLLYFQPMYLHNFFHCNPRTPQKLGFFQYFYNSKTFIVNPSCYLRLAQLHMYQ